MLKQIGKFSIVAELGEGELSRIYRAVHKDTGRTVAVKIADTKSSPDHEYAFQRDLVEAARVQHKSIVKTLDAGSELGVPYLVMDLVEGRDLARILQSRSPLKLAEQVRVMLQVAEGLKVAHEYDVFHKDIRPSKIMLADGNGKLLCLGTGRLAFDETRATADGYLVGTPLYMSPERFGDIEHADAPSDIWSWAVTFHEILAGQHPFYDELPERSVFKIIQEEPADLRDSNPDLPNPLVQLIRRAMQKKRSLRYQNFAQIVAELNPILIGIQHSEINARLAEESGGAAPTVSIPVFKPAESTKPKVATATPPTPASRKSTPPVANGGLKAAAVSKPVEPSAPPSSPNSGANRPLRAAAPTSNAPAPERPANPRASRPIEPPRFGQPQSLIKFEGKRPDYQARRAAWKKASVALAGVLTALLIVAGVRFWWGKRMEPAYTPTVIETPNSSSPRSSSTPTPLPPDHTEPSQVPLVPAATPLAGTPEATPSGDLADQDSKQLSTPRVFDPQALANPLPKRPKRADKRAIPAAPTLGAVENPGAGLDPGAVIETPSIAPPIAPETSTVAPTPTVAPPPAVKPPQVGGQFIGAELIKKVEPVYPSLAAQNQIHGTVRFVATIGKDGSVERLDLIKGDPVLSSAARRAVLQWKYKPAKLDGEPTEVTQVVEVQFTANQR